MDRGSPRNVEIEGDEDGKERTATGWGNGVRGKVFPPDIRGHLT